jgi:hypothetical protein
MFVTIPFSVVGIFQLKTGNQIIKQLWQSLYYPKCPECLKGILFPENHFDEQFLNKLKNDDPCQFHCSHCNFILNSTKKNINFDTYKLRVTKNINILNDPLIQKQKEFSIKSHKYTSRIFYTTSFISIAYGMFQIAFGGSLLHIINIMAISLPFFIAGLVRSYRAWQIKSNTLYVKGSFLHWLKYEKWFI